MSEQPTARSQGIASSSTTMTLIPYAQTLLDKSQELILGGEHNVATVVAHMACEVAAEQALSRAFATKGLEYLEDAVTDFFNGFNLGNELIRNLYNALAGREIHEQPFWQAFKGSATRRNGIMHRGENATKEQAEATYEAAGKLIAYLKS